ncbi:MAG TPA: hypothetical protein VJN20_07055 [Burkholderiales bacterium]|nr:hypothetical protein [Burkholderiales bacterium]
MKPTLVAGIHATRRFEVEGRDDKEAICRGRHMRFVVDVAKTRQRLRQKRAA